MPLEVNSDTYESEVVQSEIPVLVDFWGPQCGPCLALLPHVEKLEETYAGKVKVTKVDASKNRRLCLNLKVLGLPTFLLYQNGEILERLSGGNLTIGEIEKAVSKVLI